MNAEIFDPVVLSLEENAFLLEHAGKPPVVARQFIPPGVNVKAVGPVLDRIYELSELEKHAGEKWVGVEVIKSSIRVYLEQMAKWAADKRRGAPRFPSMHSFDGRGRPHVQGVGSDAGQVRTYFGPKGERIPFAVQYVDRGTPTWTPDWPFAVPEDVAKTLQLVVDTDKRRIECPVCSHTEQFNPDSRASFNTARARMSKHLRTATTETTEHRELHTNEFGA